MSELFLLINQYLSKIALVSCMQKILANTFTPLYDSVEDRIVLVINYEDIHNRVDLMITRSFLLKVLPSMEEFMLRHYPSAQQKNDTLSITSFQQEAAAQQSTSTNFVNLELFSKEKELLNEVNFAYNEKTQLTVLTLSSKSSSVVASLDYNMFEQLTNAIKASIPHFEWGFSMNF